MSDNKKLVESVHDLTPSSALVVVNTRREGPVGFIVPTVGLFGPRSEEEPDDDE